MAANLLNINKSPFSIPTLEMIGGIESAKVKEYILSKSIIIVPTKAMDSASGAFSNSTLLSLTGKKTGILVQNLECDLDFQFQSQFKNYSLSEFLEYSAEMKQILHTTDPYVNTSSLFVHGATDIDTSELHCHLVEHIAAPKTEKVTESVPLTPSTSVLISAVRANPTSASLHASAPPPDAYRQVTQLEAIVQALRPADHRQQEVVKCNADAAPCTPNHELPLVLTTAADGLAALLKQCSDSTTLPHVRPQSVPAAPPSAVPKRWTCQLTDNRFLSAALLAMITPQTRVSMRGCSGNEFTALNAAYHGHHQRKLRAQLLDPDGTEGFDPLFALRHAVPQQLAEVDGLESNGSHPQSKQQQAKQRAAVFALHQQLWEQMQTEEEKNIQAEESYCVRCGEVHPMAQQCLVLQPRNNIGADSSPYECVRLSLYQADVSSVPPTADSSGASSQVNEMETIAPRYHLRLTLTDGTEVLYTHLVHPLQPSSMSMTAPHNHPTGCTSAVATTEAEHTATMMSVLAHAYSDLTNLQNETLFLVVHCPQCFQDSVKAAVKSGTDTQLPSAPPPALTSFSAESRRMACANHILAQCGDIIDLLVTMRVDSDCDSGLIQQQKCVPPGGSTTTACPASGGGCVDSSPRNNDVVDACVNMGEMKFCTSGLDLADFDGLSLTAVTDSDYNPVSYVPQLLSAASQSPKFDGIDPTLQPLIHQTHITQPQQSGSDMSASTADADPVHRNVTGRKRVLSTLSRGKLWFCSNLDLNMPQIYASHAKKEEQRRRNSTDDGSGNQNSHAPVVAGVTTPLAAAEPEPEPEAKPEAEAEAAADAVWESIHVPRWMRSGCGEDVLGLCRQQIQGVSSPQVYIKVPGVWTGAHEENCRFRSVNINLGPGASEWFAVEAQHVPLLKEYMVRVHGIDIYRREGRWFPKEEWLVQAGVPYLHGLQRAGDIMYLKGCTLHWVRALGFSKHVSWNHGVLEDEQIATSLARCDINERLTRAGHAFPSLIPMQTLLLDVARVSALYLKDRGKSGVKMASAVDKTYSGISSTVIEDSLANCQLQTRVLLQLLRSIYAYALYLSLATTVTQLRPGPEGPECAVVVCSQPHCQREIFEAYLACRRCGLVCLRCALTRCSRGSNQVPVAKKSHFVDAAGEDKDLSEGNMKGGSTASKRRRVAVDRATPCQPVAKLGDLAAASVDTATLAVDPVPPSSPSPPPPLPPSQSKSAAPSAKKKTTAALMREIRKRCIQHSLNSRLYLKSNANSLNATFAVLKAAYEARFGAEQADALEDEIEQVRLCVEADICAALVE